MATTLSSTERNILSGLLGSDFEIAGAQRFEGSGHRLLGFTTHDVTLIARWPKVARPERTWWHELSVQQLAAQHGLTPQILRVDPAMQSTLLIKAAPLCLGLDAIARLLRDCHQLPQVSHKLDIARAFHYWFDLCQPENQPWTPQLNQRKAERAALQFAEFEACLVQSHGDCLATNILQLQNRVVFIDWEYHCLAPRWWDLAIYAESQQLSPEAEANLLQNYVQAPLPFKTISALRAFRAIYAELAILWHCATIQAPTH